MAQATKQSLTGTCKAAIVIAGLPSETATQILSRMDPKEAETVSIEVARLADLPEGVAEETLREFLGVNICTGGSSLKSRTTVNIPSRTPKLALPVVAMLRARCTTVSAPSCTKS